MYSNYWYYYPYLNQYNWMMQNSFRQQLDPTIFMSSANVSKRLLNEATKIVNKISSDENFAREIMEAARSSQFSKVDELIASIGLNNKVEVWFNPDGIRIELPSSPQEKGKGMLILTLAWQDFPHFV